MCVLAVIILATASLGAMIGLAAGRSEKYGKLIVYPSSPKFSAVLGAVLGASFGLGAVGCNAELSDSANIVAVQSQEDFSSQVLNSRTPVLVDFSTSWCGYCKTFAPTFSNLADEYQGRAKMVRIDGDQSRPLVDQYKVPGYPTILLFVGGKETRRWVGNVQASELRTALDAAIASQRR